MANTKKTPTKKTPKKPMDHQRKKNEQAIEQLAEMLEPAIKIFSDAEVKASFEDDDTTMVQAIVLIMKKYATEIVRIIATIDGIDYADADYTTADIVKKCLSIAQDDALMGFLLQLR